MATRVKRNKINFKGKMVSIGIDMHKHSWRITALIEGDVVLAVTLARPNYGSFTKILSQFKGNHVRVVYEAGPGGFDLYDKLTADGIEIMGSGLRLTFVDLYQQSNGDLTPSDDPFRPLHRFSLMFMINLGSVHQLIEL